MTDDVIAPKTKKTISDILSYYLCSYRYEEIELLVPHPPQNQLQDSSISEKMVFILDIQMEDASQDFDG